MTLYGSPAHRPPPGQSNGAPNQPAAAGQPAGPQSAAAPPPVPPAAPPAAPPTAARARTQGPAVATSPQQAAALAQAVAQPRVQPSRAPDTPPARSGHRQARARPLPRLRIGSHAVSDAALGAFAVSTSSTGVLLGRDADRQPVSLRLFRPEPTRVALVGGPWACQLIMLRALALGARTVIHTTAPEWWDGFGEWATGSTDRVAVLPVNQQVNALATPQEPVLLLYDAGLLGPSVQPTLGPWQTQLTVLRQLTSYGLPAVQESNVLVTQRLAPAEAEVAASALRLNDRASYLLQVLNEDMLALVTSGSERYVWITPTKVEEQLGAPRR